MLKIGKNEEFSSVLPLAAVNSLSDSEETLYSNYERNLFDFKPMDASV
jgi:hypothetical protein